MGGRGRPPVASQQPAQLLLPQQKVAHLRFFAEQLLLFLFPLRRLQFAMNMGQVDQQLLLVDRLDQIVFDAVLHGGSRIVEVVIAAQDQTPRVRQAAT